MKPFFLIALLTATPAFAQSRLYTNADLAQRTVTVWSRTVTAEELAGLAARQFTVPLARGLDRWPEPVLERVQAPNPILMPTRPLSEPWSMTTYVGRGFSGRAFGSRAGGHRGGTTHTVAPGVHLRYP